MAYKFQIGAAKLVGAIEVDGLTADSLDAQEGNISNVGALTADSIGKDDGAAQLDLVDDMRAATNKQIQFRAAEQKKSFSPNANQLAIEASASVSLDVNGGSKMMINDTAIEFKQRVEMSGSASCVMAKIWMQENFLFLMVLTMPLSLLVATLLWLQMVH